MAAAIHVFFVEQGTTWDDIITWDDAQGNPYDLTGYAVEMQIRDVSEGPLIADVTPYLTLGGTAGTITFAVPAAITEQWSWPQSKYDIKVTSSGGQVKRILQGVVKVSPGISE